MTEGTLRKGEPPSQFFPLPPGILKTLEELHPLSPTASHAPPSHLCLTHGRNRHADSRYHHLEYSLFGRSH